MSQTLNERVFRIPAGLVPHLLPHRMNRRSTRRRFGVISSAQAFAAMPVGSARVPSSTVGAISEIDGWPLAVFGADKVGNTKAAKSATVRLRHRAADDQGALRGENLLRPGG